MLCENGCTWIFQNHRLQLPNKAACKGGFSNSFWGWLLCLAHHCNKDLAMGIHETHLSTPHKSEDSCSLCYRCTGFAAQNGKRSLLAANRLGLNKPKAAGTGHCFKPEMHGGVQKYSKGTKDSDVVAITFCLSQDTQYTGMQQPEEEEPNCVLSSREMENIPFQPQRL